MSGEVNNNIFESTAVKVNYDKGMRFLGSLPVVGLVMFLFNRNYDERWNFRNSNKVTDKERMVTHYFRWRELTVSLALTALILFMIVFGDISTAAKVNLGIAGGTLLGTALIACGLTYYYRQKATGVNDFSHPSLPGIDTVKDL